MPLGGLLPYNNRNPFSSFGGIGGLGGLQGFLGGGGFGSPFGGIGGIGGIGSGHRAGGNRFLQKFQQVEPILGEATDLIELMNKLREDRLTRQERQLKRQDELYQDEYGRTLDADMKLALFGGLAGADPNSLRFTPPNRQAEKFATTKSPATLDAQPEEQQLLDYILKLYLGAAGSGLGRGSIGAARG